MGSVPNTADAEFEARLQESVAQDKGHETRSAHQVNRAMISMWADAMMDDNPVYRDDRAAIASGRSGVVAPPTMIQAWMMPPLSKMALGTRDCPGMAPWIAHAAARGIGTSAEGKDQPLPSTYAILAERGFVNSAATNCKQIYHRDYAPGDHITCISKVDAVSAEKQTAMGKGHFLTTRLDYVNQRGEAIATQYWTLLRYREKSKEPGAPKDSAPKTMVLPQMDKVPESRPGAALSGLPVVGQVTEASVFPITPSFVIATALATHDFYPIHHDVDWARSLGQPNIFTNILTTTALVGGVATRWGGPKTVLKSTDLRLLVPNFPGDTLVLQGEVTEVDGEEVTLKVIGENNLGTHVDATVTVVIPA